MIKRRASAVYMRHLLKDSRVAARGQILRRALLLIPFVWAAVQFCDIPGFADKSKGEMTHAPAAPQVIRVLPLSDLDRKFRSDTAWRGSDAALSVALDDERVLWFFGDTWICSSGKNGKSEKSGKGSAKREMVRNTVALQNLRHPDQPFRYYWRNSAGKGMGIFAPADTNDWYWPGAGTVYDGRLYLIVKRVKSKNEGPPEFQFDWYGDDLLVIENPCDEPDKWRWTSFRLPDHDGKFRMGTAIACYEGYLYVFSSVQSAADRINAHPAGLARITMKDLVAMDMSKWQYWGGGNGNTHGAWSNSAQHMTPLFPDAAPEMSVQRASDWRFIAVYQPPLSPHIMLRQAARPEGPWSAPTRVYTCPEANIMVKGRKTLTYAARAHAELSKGNELVLTYCVNPGGMEQHSARPDLYFPRCLLATLK
ncbi:MAG TPA: DUF4185 domain-containing protein [Candidatus Obscuribacterales bacterium]